MPYPATEQALPGPEAFDRKTTEAALARAAILLHIGSQLRGDGAVLEARAEALDLEWKGLVLPPNSPEFPVPRVQPTGERFVLGPALDRPRTRERGRDADLLAEAAEKPLRELAAELYGQPSPRAACALAQACLTDPDELTRVAAATVHFRLSADPRPSVKTLARATRSDDELVREVAATALARIAPRHPSLQRLLRPSFSRREGQASHTSLLVHGTFAGNSSWWTPGGSFHSYLLGIRPDLYAASDRFAWSGRYSERGRDEGARQLREWILQHGLEGLDLFTHSHGGSLAMVASQAGLSIGRLVVLSYPVDPDDVPDFARIGRVVSVRVKWDLVILADGGGQEFVDPRVAENVLPVWFNHSATHSPDVWERYDVRSML